MITLENLSFRYSEKDEYILQNLDCEIRQGENVVIIGANGSGKSTLAKIIAGLVSPSSGTIRYTTKQRSKPYIGFLQQIPENQIVASTVELEIAFGLENRQLPSAEIRKRVDQTLNELNLTHLCYRNPAKLSGGEMQRVAFATLYAMRPDIWILDEPVAFLDPIQRSIIADMVTALPEQSTVLWIASSPHEILPGQRTLQLKNGRLVEINQESTGTSSAAHLPPPRDTVAGEGGNTSLESLPSSNLMTAKNVNVFRQELFGPSVQILHDVSLHQNCGDIHLLSGPSGCGKTTLLEAFTGLLPLHSGIVLWNGKQASDQFGHIGMSFQFPERSFFAETVLDEIAFGARNMGATRNDADNRARECLARFGLDPDEFGDRNPFELSVGQARRVALASIMALSPLAYLLDEPTAGLDMEGCSAVFSFIREEAKRGAAFLIAGHDIERLSQISDSYVWMDNGRLTNINPYANYIESTNN